MRIGMTTGADDYITKPFRPGELREAAAAQLNKRVMQATLQGMAVDAAVQAALEDQKHKLAKLYEQRLAKELSERWPSGDGTAGDERFDHATVLFVDIPNYATVAEKLIDSGIHRDHTIENAGLGIGVEAEEDFLHDDRGSRVEGLGPEQRQFSQTNLPAVELMK